METNNPAQQTHIVWQETVSVGGDPTHYGMWEGAKVFSLMRWNDVPKGQEHKPRKFRLKSALPGFRPDLPLQDSLEAGKAFAERMLQRWVAKRGLLFKSHIVMTDAMLEAASDALGEGHGVHGEHLRRAIVAAIQAREPVLSSPPKQVVKAVRR